MEVLQEGLYPKAGHFSSGPFTSGLLQEMPPAPTYTQLRLRPSPGSTLRGPGLQAFSN